MKRPRYPMPEDVAAALAEAGMTEAYGRRPPYQQNDYIGWINRARLPATRRKRIGRMLDELKRGGVYMKMAWNG